MKITGTLIGAQGFRSSSGTDCLFIYVVLDFNDKEIDNNAKGTKCIQLQAFGSDAIDMKTDAYKLLNKPVELSVYYSKCDKCKSTKINFNGLNPLKE